VYVYKLMPRVRVAWRDVWIGAAVTSVLFTVGRLLIGLYIGHSSMASGYGAAGSLVVVLLWVYYSAQVFLLGAEFTWVYARRHGSLKAVGAAQAKAQAADPTASAPGAAPAQAGAKGEVPRRGAEITAAPAPAPKPTSTSKVGLGGWLLAGAAAGGALLLQNWLARRVAPAPERWFAQRTSRR
jgi:hypothetical protein